MRDLTNLKTYIIDSENPHEVDDAISLEILDGYVKKIWIHISNPCLFFPQNSSIDNDFQSGIHYHATGSGKSWIAMYILEAFDIILFILIKNEN